MKIELNIPPYFSIEDYGRLTQMEHLTDSEKMIQTLLILTDKPYDEVSKWDIKLLSDVYIQITNMLIDLEPSFYPIIEMNSKLYGFQPISKFTLGEYIDLENLLKHPEQNLVEIMAILYRPIVKNRFKSIEYAFKHGWKIGKGEVESMFKYYDIEPYDSSKRLENSQAFGDFPATFALGSLGFFLSLANISSLGMSLYSRQNSKKSKIVLTKLAQMSSMNIGAGSRLFIDSRKLISLPSMEIKAL